MRRRTVVVGGRPPMWVVDLRFWHLHPDATPVERIRLHGEAADEWIERASQDYTVPGFDPFDDRGAFELEAAEAAIRAGEVW